MDTRRILESLKGGDISLGDAERLLSLHSIEEVEGFAKIDVNRARRRGIPEVIFAETKRLEEIKKIAKRALESNGSVVVSRMREEDAGKVVSFARRLGARARTGKNSSSALLYKRPVGSSGGVVGIITAGTSDIGVAEEARLMCEAMGCRCITSYDVGVAGIQRIFPVLRQMVDGGADCMVVAAGMEGALATLVSTLTDIPVIGIPTSVGYGYGGGGIAALASMLQSCSLGMSVVNIDGGIAAGGIAANIATRAARGTGGGGARGASK